LAGDGGSSNLDADGRRLFLFGLILHQTHSPFWPHVEPFEDEKKDTDLPTAV
jgi:hypothetical protein